MTKKTPPSKPFISSWRAVIATLGADATHEQSPDETPNADDAQTHLATADQVTRGPHSLAADDGQLPTPDTYALVLTHEQRQAARAAFELYARLGMGQLDYVADLLRAGLVVYNSEPQETPTQRARRTEDFEDCLLRLKKQFSGHAPTAYYSIHSPTVNSSCRAAWDMHKLLSHQFEKERGLTGTVHSVLADCVGDGPAPRALKLQAKSVSFVIFLNDAPQLVVNALSNETVIEADARASVAMDELAEQHYATVKGQYPTKRKYSTDYGWHLQQVDSLIAGI